MSLGIIVHCLQVTGEELDQGEEEKHRLQGLLLVGDLNIDPKGEEVPWPIPPIGFANGAHLAWTDLCCTSEGPPGKAT